MRASWFPLLIGTLGSLWAMPEARALERAAVVVGIDNLPDFSPELELSGAAGRAIALGKTLEAAGFERVEVFTGSGATREVIEGALHAAHDALGPSGTLVFIYEGHGIGGDYGDARLLSWDDASKDMSSTAMDVEELPARLGKADGDRHFVVLTDAVHAGSHEGTSLRGPVAGDWYDSGTRFGVISATGASQVSTPGLLHAALITGLEGAADQDQNKTVVFGELIWYLQSQLGKSSGGQMTPIRAGGLAMDHPIATAVGGQTSAAVPTPPQPVASTSEPAATLRPVALGVGAAGVGLGAVSIVMYAAKRPDCISTSRGLTCGNSSGYATYRRLQNGTGMLGGIMLAAGTTLWFQDSGPVAIGPGTVRLSGQF